MGRILMILEVSQKQSYIFASRKLRDNKNRSMIISYVTSSAYFESVAGDVYSVNENLVYSGGGHTVLSFETKEKADAFARKISVETICKYPDIELYIKQIDADKFTSPKEALLELSKQLEMKKALRKESFKLKRFGIEQIKNERVETVEDSREKAYVSFIEERGWKTKSEPENWFKVDKDDNFLAVVHVDGNSMGKRVQNIYENCGNDWNKCVETLRLFSESIDEDFESAFIEMITVLIDKLDKIVQPNDEKVIPIRRIVRAGDDICFVCASSIALECATIFLRCLEKKVNKADHKNYSACAGVSIIHSKYPFRQAYDLSEQLCSSAKRFVADNGGDFSAIDWHIEYGQMKPSLSMIRDDYFAEDGTSMMLRPLSVDNNVDEERTYDYFVKQLIEISSNKSLSRGKLKNLRTAIGQGEQETKVAIINANAGSNRGKLPEDIYYVDKTGKKYNKYFDAIEMMGKVKMWEN